MQLQPVSFLQSHLAQPDLPLFMFFPGMDVEMSEHTVITIPIRSPNSPAIVAVVKNYPTTLQRSCLLIRKRHSFDQFFITKKESLNWQTIIHFYIIGLLSWS